MFERKKTKKIVYFDKNIIDIYGIFRRYDEKDVIDSITRQGKNNNYVWRAQKYINDTRD